MSNHVRFDELDHYQPVEGVVISTISGEVHGLGDVSVVVRSESQPGYGPPEHTHEYLEIFVVQTGRGRYTVGGNQYDAGPGDVIIVPPDTTHGFVNIGDDVLRHTAIHMTQQVPWPEDWRIPAPV